MQNQVFIIAREGFQWIGIGVLLTLVLIILKAPLFAIFSGILTLFIVSFFRNPKRSIPSKPGLIVSPADGKICLITEAHEKKFLKEPRRRVSIFMSPFNCHINRAPISGKVLDTSYSAGKFHVASVDKASDFNEQSALLLEDEQKNKFVVVQIAGWLCRRIVRYVKVGDCLLRGERFGLIQFGSRVDLYLPPKASLQVHVGQSVRAGETVIGTLE